MINKSLLNGIRVLDFSRILVGAYSSMMLADLGAEVIKVEPPNGDETRKWGPPFLQNDSIYYLSINRNKKSISLDLKKPESQKIANELITKSDILIENFTCGKMKEFNLDYESVSKYSESNKKLIYATVNSYGNKGIMKTIPSFDLIIQAYTGVMNITGGENTEPFKVGFPMCDIMAGSHTYGAIMTALLHRSLNGEGQYINTSLLEANLFAMPTIVSSYLNNQINSKRRGNDHPTISPYTIFKLKNGNFIAIGVATDLQFNKLWRVLNLNLNEKNYEKFASNKLRLENREELKNILQTAINKFDSNIIFDLFLKNGIPHSNINSMKDVFSEDNQQIKQLELVKKIHSEEYGELKYIRNPITYSKTQLQEMKPPPSFGKDTRILLKNILNFSDHKIDHLYKSKIIF